MDNYNLIAKEYSKIRFPNERLDFTYEFFLQLINSNNHRNILDYGCGEGQITQEIAKIKGRNITGVDISEKMLEIAKTTHLKPNISYRLLNEDFWSQSVNLFDCAISSCVFCIFPEVEKIRATFRKIYNSLKPLGVFYLLLPDYGDCNGAKFSNVENLFKPNLKEGDAVQGILRNKEEELLINDIFWSRKTYIKLLEKSGFKLELIHNLYAEKDDSFFIPEKYIARSFILKGKKIVMPDDLKNENQ